MLDGPHAVGISYKREPVSFEEPLESFPRRIEPPCRFLQVWCWHFRYLSGVSTQVQHRVSASSAPITTNDECIGADMPRSLAGCFSPRTRICRSADDDREDRHRLRRIQPAEFALRRFHWGYRAAQFLWTLLLGWTCGSLPLGRRERLCLRPYCRCQLG